MHENNIKYRLLCIETCHKIFIFCITLLPRVSSSHILVKGKSINWKIEFHARPISVRTEVKDRIHGHMLHVAKINPLVILLIVWPRMIEIIISIKLSRARFANV